MKVKKTILCICMAIMFTLTGCASIQNNIQSLSNKINEVKLESFSSDLDGVWNAELADGTDLSIIIKSESEKLYLTSKKEGCICYLLRDSGVKDGKLHFLIPRKSSNLIFDLSLTKDNKLVGSSKFYDETEDISFTRETKDYVIKQAQTSDFDYSYEELKALIKENSKYEDDGIDYEFSYDLGDKESNQDIIKKYKIDEAAGDKSDVELMESLLNWECDLLDHSSDNIAEKHDIKSLIEDGLENGTNCRGLSLILSEVLRMYGIKAQAIACIPYSNVYSDCHVVVNAYSENLKQWVLLDPTHRIILKDESGKYVSVQSLRENIVNNVKMTRNSNAGHNEEKMTNVNFQEYLEYMAKNSCRYIKTEKNYDGCDIAKDNVDVVLVSGSYEEPRDEREDYNFVITTNSEKFWNN